MSANRVQVFTIGKAGVVKGTAVPAPAGVDDSIVADVHWRQVEAAAGTDEVGLIAALARVPVKPVAKASRVRRRS